MKRLISVKHSFMNIRGLHSSFVDHESFLESNSPDIIALCEKNLDDSVDSGTFSERSCLHLIQRESSTHMHVFAVYMKEGLPFAEDLSRNHLQILTYVFSWLYFTVLLLFPLLITFFVFVNSF